MITDNGPLSTDNSVIRTSSFVIEIVFFLLCLSPASHASDKPAFDPGGVEKIIQKFARIQKPVNGKAWTFREDRIREKLSSDGREVKTTHAVYEWRSRGDLRESRLMQLDGIPVAGSFVSEGASTELSDWNFEKVTQRFNFKIMKFEKMDSRDIARVHFSPKEKQPRPKDRLEKVISNLEGDLWLVFQEQQLVKAWAQIREPVKFGRGILGRVRKLEISYRQRPLDGDWVADSFQLEIDMRNKFSTTRVRERRNYSDFREWSP
ncbi:MAG TPA: hypothetical protein VGQ81_16880 [Acidobacteriota bacterium]|jgi:hypothetical protein|nr:hypothetical protein [Acidobacteriota bacterium]